MTHLTPKNHGPGHLYAPVTHRHRYSLYLAAFLCSSLTAQGQTPYDVTAPARGWGRLCDYHADQPALLEKAAARLLSDSESYRHPRLDVTTAIGPGKMHAAVPLLRKRLSIETTGSPYLMDSVVTAALREYQSENGLKATGVLDRETADELNVPALHRARRMLLNAERWRGTLAVSDTLTVIVNVADQTLAAVRNGSTMITMKVVVGKPGHRTPLFSSRIRCMEFWPSWHVPPGILKREVIPGMQRDSLYLKNHDMYITARGDGTTVSVVQRPGEKNPMGTVKFYLPNPYFVFLHDSPEKELFTRHKRAFSSGCIRLENAKGLARLLLENDARTQSVRMEQIGRTPATQLICLGESVPVKIVYISAWIGNSGRVQFARDIYGLDAADAGGRTK